MTEITLSAIPLPIGSRRKVVGLSVATVPVDCLVDTGSDRSLLNASLLSALAMTDTDVHLRPSTTRVRAEGGHPLTVKGEVTLTLGLPTEFIRWTFVVVEDLLHDAILGNDWFEQCGVVIDFKNRQVRCDTFSRPLRLKNINCKENDSGKNTVSDTAIIQIQKPIEIPARSQIVIPITIDSELPVGDYIFERSRVQQHKDLHLANEIIFSPILNRSPYASLTSESDRYD